MSQEDKKLLLKDISSRLPYGVILEVDTTDWREPQGYIKVKIEGMGILFKDMSLIVNGSYYGDKYKPYLRPMSSMTEEEKIDYQAFFNYDGIEYPDEYIDWLNAHHFDYRGLIEKGLAIEAPEGMYNQNLQKMTYKYFPIEFSSYEDYIKYLKEKGLAIEVTENNPYKN